MHDLIVEALLPLDIDLGFMKYEGNAKEYIIFNVYDEKDSNLCDDINLSETYYIQVNYWFKSLKNISKYKQIKDILKSKGFYFDNAVDLVDEDFYGKSMDFIYVNFREEK